MLDNKLQTSIASLIAEWRKWLQTARISWAKQLVYKFNFILMVIGPGLIFFFVKYNLWYSIYTLSNVKQIQGYDLQEMLRYQVWVVVITFLAQGYNSMNLAQDIRMGRISSYLIYPFDFWKFHTASFVASLALQVIVGGLTAFVAWGFGVLDMFSWQDVGIGVVLSMLASLLWFAVNFLLGLIAFWLEETWVFRVMFVLISTFLSGSLIPVDLFPSWLANLVFFTPFPYLTYVPASAFMGEYAQPFLVSCTALLFWIVAVGWLGRLTWRRGMRLYTGAGM